MNDLDNQRIHNLISTIDLMEFSIQLMRQNLKRRYPGEGSSYIEEELRRWLHEQPRFFFDPDLKSNDI